MNLLGLTFLNPLFLIGLASAAIPLLIHLSRSRRTKKMRFSTTRFFTDQFLRSQRMSRIKELLLLLCRMALFGLLAAALAQPLVMPKASLSGSASRHVVVVLDNSASMGYVENGLSRLDRARSAVLELFDGFGDADRLTVILAARRQDGPRLLFEGLPRLREQYRLEPLGSAWRFQLSSPQRDDEWETAVRSLLDLQPEPLGTDLTAALTKADAFLRGKPQDEKHIYILSDLQVTGWNSPEDGQSPIARGSDASIFFVKVGNTRNDNIAVTGVQYSAPRPMVGVPYEIRPYLAFGEGRDAAKVRLVVDGKTQHETEIRKTGLSQFGTQRFKHLFDQGGWHWGYIEVEDPTLPADNRRYFAVQVLDSLHVLAINGSPSKQEETLDELFFFRLALEASAELIGSSPIRLNDQLSPNELPTRNLNDPALWEGSSAKGPNLVVLANVESLSTAAVEKLENYVDAGGSLLVFLGDKVNPAFYNNVLAATARRGGLLPGRLQSLVGDANTSTRYATIGEVNYDHLALGSFRDPKSGDLSRVGLQAYWKIDPGEATVLMRSSTGDPLLTEKSFGRGRVMLFASTLDRDWTDFPKWRVYVPWLYRLIAYLAQDTIGRQGFASTGEAFEVPIPAGEGSVTVLARKPQADGSPGGAEGYPVPGSESAQRLLFLDTDRPGIYQFRRSDQSEAQAALLAVNLDNYESDLTDLEAFFRQRKADDAQWPTPQAKTEAGLRDLLPGHLPEKIRYLSDPMQLTEALRESRRTFQLWNALLVVVLLIALLEPWLANRIALRHYGKPKEILDPTLGRTSLGAGRLIPKPPPRHAWSRR